MVAPSSNRITWNASKYPGWGGRNRSTWTRQGISSRSQRCPAVCSARRTKTRVDMHARTYTHARRRNAVVYTRARKNTKNKCTSRTPKRAQNKTDPRRPCSLAPVYLTASGRTIKSRKRQDLAVRLPTTCSALQRTPSAFSVALLQSTTRCSLAGGTLKMVRYLHRMKKEHATSRNRIPSASTATQSSDGGPPRTSRVDKRLRPAEDRPPPQTTPLTSRCQPPT